MSSYVKKAKFKVTIGNTKLTDKMARRVRNMAFMKLSYLLVEIQIVFVITN